MGVKLGLSHKRESKEWERCAERNFWTKESRSNRKLDKTVMWGASSNIIRFDVSWAMGRPVHVTRVGEIKNAYKIFEGKGPIGTLRRGW